jgi:hypothetical protein
MSPASFLDTLACDGNYFLTGSAHQNTSARTSFFRPFLNPWQSSRIGPVKRRGRRVVDDSRELLSDLSESQDSKIVSALADIRNRLAELWELQDNWDSYGARKPRDCLMQASWDLAFYLISNGHVQMSIVPTVVGGLQFEWSNSEASFEIEVNDINKFGLYFEARSGEEFEEEIRADDLHKIEACLKRLV